MPDASAGLAAAWPDQSAQHVTLSLAIEPGFRENAAKPKPLVGGTLDQRDGSLSS